MHDENYPSSAGRTIETLNNRVYVLQGRIEGLQRALDRSRQFNDDLWERYLAKMRELAAKDKRIAELEAERERA